MAWKDLNTKITHIHTYIHIYIYVLIILQPIAISCLCAAFRRRMLGYSSDGELIGEGDKTSADCCDSKSCLSNRRGSTGSLSFLASHRCRLLDRRSSLWPSGRCCASLSFAQEDPHHLLPSFLPASVRIFYWLTMVNGLFNIDSLRFNWLQPRLVPFLIGKPAHAVSQTHVLKCMHRFLLWFVTNCQTRILVWLTVWVADWLTVYRVAAVLLYGMGFQLSICPHCLTRPSLSLSMCPCPSVKKCRHNHRWSSFSLRLYLCLLEARTCNPLAKTPEWVTKCHEYCERNRIIQSCTQGIKQSPVLHLVLSAVGTARRWQLWLMQQHHIGAHS